MKAVDLRALVLPSGVRVVVPKLLAALEVADTAQGVNMAAVHAEGFVLGLETPGAFRAADIEPLYVGFEQAKDNRLQALRDA